MYVYMEIERWGTEKEREREVKQSENLLFHTIISSFSYNVDSTLVH